jgi:hypothetical protein
MTRGRGPSITRTESVITAKIERTTAEALREEARRNDRTLSGQVRKVLREWAEQGARG